MPPENAPTSANEAIGAALRRLTITYRQSCTPVVTLQHVALPGRDGDVRDVLADTVGALLGWALLGRVSRGR